MDFPGGDTLVADLDRCHFFTEGEKKFIELINQPGQNS